MRLGGLPTDQIATRPRLTGKDGSVPSIAVKDLR
jgi:hypothetical protein